MKKYLIFLALGFSMLLSTYAIAAPWTNVLGYTPFAYERITVTNAAVSQLNAANRAASGAVFITVETHNFRYRIDGGNPTAIEGHLVIAGALQNLWFIDPASIKAFRAIAIGGNATLIVTYYRRN